LFLASPLQDQRLVSGLHGEERGKDAASVSEKFKKCKNFQPLSCHVPERLFIEK
jgi:hypothetical protein